MKRVALTIALVAFVGAAVFASLGAKPSAQEGDARYFVEMDNAFGLIEGGDVKVAGVRAGKIEGLEVDPKTYRAVVEISIGKKGFGDLRMDAFCESRPQSLIGEYFMDCLPGTDDAKLPRGGRVPVQQTGSTIPPDLINNIYRRPYRERFSILIGELGAAFAARGEDLNETIRRANPALRETNKVLAELREQRRVIRALADDAEDVVVALAGNKLDVGRFIEEARDTAAASAARHGGLRRQFQEFPGFLRELRPTMRLLGEAADRQRPALVNLSNNAPLLRRFLDDLGPFSEASRPAIRSLAAASRTGRSAVRVANPRVRELRTFAKQLPEVATNLAIILEHLHNRDFAVEKDERAPEGRGFTGIEAVLQYIFRQTMAINTFDGNSHLLKVSAFLDNNCAPYADANIARDPNKQYCRAILGPNQPGIDTPDPKDTKKKARRAPKRERRDADRRKTAPAEPGERAKDDDRKDKPDSPVVPNLELPGPVQDLLDDVLPQKPANPLDTGDLHLLDYLLGQ
ncbi:MAG TPA: MlaD family protein [Solirubrobacteraceae bacterium]|nr:MlaD family protein [Solirubrobacteraceae bacterium]